MKRWKKLLEDGTAIIIQMDANCHLGSNIIENDPNVQNENGKIFEDFLSKNTNLNLLNALPICQGLITRYRKNN